MLTGTRARRPADIGTRDRPVTVEQLTQERGPSGFPVEKWTVLTPLEMMHRQDSMGGEQFTAGQLSAQIVTYWDMGYRPDMDPDQVDMPRQRRLVYSGRVYDIVAASVINRSEGIELATLASSKRVEGS